LLKKYDVSKYTFTRTVVIEERAMNHRFPGADTERSLSRLR
jgi:hypothetical protein